MMLKAPEDYILKTFSTNHDPVTENNPRRNLHQQFFRLMDLKIALNCLWFKLKPADGISCTSTCQS